MSTHQPQQQQQHHGGRDFLRPSQNNINNNNPSGMNSLIMSSRSTDDRAMFSKSLGGDYSPLRSMLHRHVSSDISNITYSGYLLKRSNQPYNSERQNHHSSNPFPILDPSNLMDAPDLPILFAPSNTYATTSNSLKNNDSSLLLRSNIVDVDGPYSATTPPAVPQHHQQQQGFVVVGEHRTGSSGGDGNPNAPWTNLDKTFPSSSSSDHQKYTTGGPLHHHPSTQQQEQLPFTMDETDDGPADTNDNKEVTKNAIEQGWEFCAAFLGLKLGEDHAEQQRKRDATATKQQSRGGGSSGGMDSSTLTSGSNASSSADLLYSQQQQQQIGSGGGGGEYRTIPLPMIQKRSSPIKVASSSSLVSSSSSAAVAIPQPTTTAATSGSAAAVGFTKRESFLEPILHRRSSAPLMVESSSSSAPPVSFIDPVDGHLWRAKYCVLEDGVLYFYRNPSDAECAEAIHERSQTTRNSGWDDNTTSSQNNNVSNDPDTSSPNNNPNSYVLGSGSGHLRKDHNSNNNNNHSTMPRSNAAMMSSGTLSSAAAAKDLSKSPMARRGTYRDHLSSSSDTYGSGATTSGALWEKRVFLNCVGAVRSAELEYGKNSFELVAINEDDDGRSPDSNGHGDNSDDDEDDPNSAADKLVLQAQNNEEMNEWLFQFHRSLASFLMNLMDVVGSKSRGAYLDIQYPAFYHQPLNDAPLPAVMPAAEQRPGVASSYDPRRARMASYSPRFHHLQQQQHAAGSVGGHSLPHSASLSHGHGRNALHRRRVYGSGGNGETPSSSYHSTGNNHHHHPKLSFSENETSSLSSTPDTAGGSSLGGGSTQMPFALREPSPLAGGIAAQFRFSPARHGSPEQPFLLRPPQQLQQQQQQQQQHNSQLSPTKTDLGAPGYSAPQSQPDSETERPVPAKTTGKYIPPALMRAKQQEQQGGSGTAAAAPKTLYVPLHLRKKQQESGSTNNTTTKKWVPPHRRNGGSSTNDDGETKMVPPTSGNPPSLLSLAERAKNAPEPALPQEAPNDDIAKEDQLDVVGRQSTPFHRGGCADPQVVQGSILDANFIPKKASKMGPTPTPPFGCYGGGDIVSDASVSEVEMSANDDGNTKAKQTASTLRWEVGAVSECGIRNSNEDSYLISCNLIDAFRSLPRESSTSDGDLDAAGEDDKPPANPPTVPSTWVQNHNNEADHDLGLFAVFDGHCGDQAARFAAEKLAHFIHEESKQQRPGEMESDAATTSMAGSAINPLHPSHIEQVLGDAVVKLDTEFCRLCVEEGREWESGATALVAMLAKEHLVIANLGDCRGVLCRYVESDSMNSCNVSEEWSELGASLEKDDGGDNDYTPGGVGNGRCMWKEVTNTHSPGKEEERIRIEQANGWVTTETEIPIGQLRRMDFLDADVIDILKRCFSDRCQEASGSGSRSAAPQRILHIFRVCGELSVSRALGDRDFKAAHNTLSPTGRIEYDTERINEVDDGLSAAAKKSWDCPLFLPYPDLHSKTFLGDLVSNTPDFHRVRVGEEGVSDEFLLLACDGLWDVMDTDDAVRVTRDLLFQKKWTAKKAAARLAELAVHLGSSDNITVIVVRFFQQASF